VQSNNHVLVIDFGAQYAQLIARRVRQAGVYSEIISHKSSLEEILARNPRAIILSGGPSSVYVDDAPLIDRALSAILQQSYFQALIHHLTSG